MAGIKVKQRIVAAAWLVCWCLVLLIEVGRAERPFLRVFNGDGFMEKENEEGFFLKFVNSFWLPSFHSAWPELEFGWKLIVGTIIGFFGAAMGSIGGVGGGGIFVPMLTLIIGFGPKSATAISKCMIMGAAGSTVYYNLKLRHPTLDLPIIDYDLALLVQPMMLLGISIGVVFNIIFAEWMVTILLIILFLVTSTRAFVKGVETWKQESIMKKEAARILESISKLPDNSGQEYDALSSSPSSFHIDEVSVMENVYWKDFTLLLSVWVAFLAIQMVKTYAVKCSVEYWILSALQLPIAVSVSLYEAISLYRGKRTVASIGKETSDWKVHQLFLYCLCGILAGVVGGLLGLGGGFILGPLFLELGVPPQVASATSTFAMLFSSSMSVVQYYFLKRFPVPYAAYFVVVATIAALTGQHMVRKLVRLLGRASLIIFVLALTIFVSAISLGGVGLADWIDQFQKNEHMGFQSLCLKT
ncbi:hypothetical protein ACHQM5_022976 [Ranunculus cassubicifolius]